MDNNRTRSLTDMLSGLDWSEASRGIGYREGRARSLFNEAAFNMLESALSSLALRGDEMVLTSLAEDVAKYIVLDQSCSESERRHVVLRFMDMFRSLPRTAAGGMIEHPVIAAPVESRFDARESRS